jgi:hypothetical protein
MRNRVRVRGPRKESCLTEATGAGGCQKKPAPTAPDQTGGLALAKEWKRQARIARGVSELKTVCGRQENWVPAAYIVACAASVTVCDRKAIAKA